MKQEKAPGRYDGMFSMNRGSKGIKVIIAA
jgi:hypothetical protein